VSATAITIAKYSTLTIAHLCSKAVVFSKMLMPAPAAGIGIVMRGEPEDHDHDRQIAIARGNPLPSGFPFNCTSILPRSWQALEQSNALRRSCGDSRANAAHPSGETRGAGA
jgi:hypothetical protein